MGNQYLWSIEEVSSISPAEDSQKDSNIPLFFQNISHPFTNILGFQNLSIRSGDPPRIFKIGIWATDQAGKNATNSFLLVVKNNPLQTFFQSYSFERIAPRQLRLRNYFLTLPNNELSLQISPKSIKIYHFTDYRWIIDSGSPLQYSFESNSLPVLNLTNLTQGTYRILILMSNPHSSHNPFPMISAKSPPQITPGKKFTFSVISITVNPVHFRNYDTSVPYFPNQNLIPVEMNQKPWLPICNPSQSNDQQPNLADLEVQTSFRKFLQKYYPPAPNAGKNNGNRDLIVTFISKNYLLLGKNLICSIKNQNMTNFLIILLDSETHSLIQVFLRSVYPPPSASSHTFNETRSLFFDSKLHQMIQDPNVNYKSIIKLKTTFIQILLQESFNPLVLDADTSILANPFPKIALQSSLCDISFQLDGKYRFHPTQYAGIGYLNAGVYYAKSSQKTIDLFQDWIANYDCEGIIREQIAMQISLHNSMRGRWIIQHPQRRVYKVNNDILRFCFLPPRDFPDGGYFNFPDLYHLNFGPKSRPTVVHANNMNQMNLYKYEALKRSNTRFYSRVRDTCFSV